MKKLLYKHRFLMMRRLVQLTVLMLYVAANTIGFNFLVGNLSSSLLLGLIPLADPFAVLQILSAGAMVGIDVMVGALIVALFYTIVGGRAFCSWVCPVNMVTDSANWLRRVLYLEKIERKVWLGRSVRYWIIGLTLVVSFISGVAAFEMISPIGMMHRGIIFGMGMGFAALLSLFLFDLFAVKNGWCGHICPLGGFYSLLGKFSLVRVKHDQSTCTLCMKCKDICPEKQVLSIIGKESGAIVSGECTNCGRCVEVCDDNALNFGVRNYINSSVGEKE